MPARAGPHAEGCEQTTNLGCSIPVSLALEREYRQALDPERDGPPHPPLRQAARFLVAEKQALSSLAQWIRSEMRERAGRGPTVPASMWCGFEKIPLAATIAGGGCS